MRFLRFIRDHWQGVLVAIAILLFALFMRWAVSTQREGLAQDMSEEAR